VAGMLARCDQAGVWHRMPPVDTTLKGGLAPLHDLAERQAASLQRLGVNTFVRLQPGVATLQGNVSFAGTAVVESWWQSLGIMRLTSFILRSVERHTRWVFNPQHPEELAADLERQVWIFLSRLKQREALAGATPEQSFFVRTHWSRGRRRENDDGDVALTLRVGFAPRAPNEFLVYDFRFHALTLDVEVVAVRDAERYLG
jgi:phage tail sheath protein FI